MTLTAKAKQDFEDWYTAITPSAHSLLLVHFYNKKEIEQYAWYIEWFDSVGIYISINYEKEWFTNEIQYKSHISPQYSFKGRRDLVTKMAIIKANELYNNRNNNQD